MTDGASVPGHKILVTRPLPGAGRTAARLRAAGFDPIVAPLTIVEATREAPPEGPFDALLATSANGAAGLGALSPDLLALPVFAVGPRTAAAAQAAGAGRVEAGIGDARDLAGMVAAALPPGSRVLYAAGRERKSDLERELGKRGYRLALWIAYGAVAVPTLPEEAAAALRARSLGAVLHYSRRGAELLLQLSQAAGLLAEVGELRHVCLSQDIASALRAAGFHRVDVALRPNEEALLRVLSTTGDPDPRAGSRADP